MRKKKSLVGILLCVLLMFIPVTGYAASIEPERPSSLTIEYGNQDVRYMEAEVSIYRIAEVFADQTYALTGAFAKYPVNIYGIKSQSEWDVVRDTLSAHIIIDKIEATAAGITDENGLVTFSDILPGMYLVSDVKIENDKEVVLFESFLVSVPSPNANGTYNYDVKSYPKCIFHEIKPDSIEHKVVKLWKDYGKEEQRPEMIEVDIYRDGVLHATTQLTSANNWTYSWEAMDDGSKWTAVEKNIPEEYTMTTVVEGNTILITNACETVEEKPETGDQTTIWPYILGLCFSGMIFIIIGIWRKRRA